MNISEQSIRCVNGVPDDSKSQCKHVPAHKCMRIADRVNWRIAYLQHRVADRLKTTVAVLVEEPPAPLPCFFVYFVCVQSRRPTTVVNLTTIDDRRGENINQHEVYKRTCTYLCMHIYAFPLSTGKQNYDKA